MKFLGVRPPCSTFHGLIFTGLALSIIILFSGALGGVEMPLILIVFFVSLCFGISYRLSLAAAVVLLIASLYFFGTGDEALGNTLVTYCLYLMIMGGFLAMVQDKLGVMRSE